METLNRELWATSIGQLENEGATTSPVFSTGNATISVSGVSGGYRSIQSVYVVSQPPWTEGDIIKKIDERVNQLVSEKLRELFKERKVIFKKVNDSVARNEIRDFILGVKRKGIKTLNIIDIVDNLNLPAEQIERIMNQFVQKQNLFET